MTVHFIKSGDSIARTFKPITFEFVEGGKRIIKGMFANLTKGEKATEKKAVFNAELYRWEIKSR